MNNNFQKTDLVDSLVQLLNTKLNKKLNEVLKMLNEAQVSEEIIDNIKSKIGVFETTENFASVPQQDTFSGQSFQSLQTNSNSISTVQNITQKSASNINHFFDFSDESQYPDNAGVKGGICGCYIAKRGDNHEVLFALKRSRHPI